MIPMGECTCIGTTDTRTDHAVEDPSGDDIQFLLDNANALVSLQHPLTRSDIIATRCGVRPLVVRHDATVGKVDWAALSRKHEIDVHPERNYCSIYGGKLTDCLNIGEETADIIASFGIALFSSFKPWFGEPDIEQYNRFRTQCRPLGLSAEEQERLWRRYGIDAFALIENMQRDERTAESIIGPYTRAELHIMAEHEMILTLDDFLRRRTRLALTMDPTELNGHLGLSEAGEILL